MAENKDQDNLIYQVEGPAYKDGDWQAKIVLKQQQAETFRAGTKREVQEQILHYLGQQALEIEKARVLLRKAFETQHEN